MARTVLLSIMDGQWNKWGDNFVKRQPLARTQMLIGAKPTVDEAKAALIRAVTEAGTTGTVIISVGHGVAVDGSTIDGMVELAPGGVMRLVGLNGSVPPGFVRVFYDKAPDGPGQQSDLDFDLKNNPKATRLAHWRVYQEIAQAFRTTKPYEVVLLTCRIGGATEFLRKIANDWGVVVRAYKVRVGLDTNSPRPLVFLENRPPPYSTAADTVLHEEELPFAPADTIRIGPPPP